MASSTTTILFQNLPVKTFIGINLVSFNSSPNFRGVTNIPNGLHFVYTGADASLSIRHGQWLNTQSSGINSQLFFFEWVAQDERLGLVTADDAISRDDLVSASDFQHQGLVNYDALIDASTDIQSRESAKFNDDTESEKADWPMLISHLSSTCIDRILTKSWIISSISSAPVDTETIPGLTRLEASSVLPESNLNFIPVDLKKTWPNNAVGRERTEKARDRSWYLGSLIDQVIAEGQSRQTGAKELLGELQFCFLMVLTLANYSCLEQWKRILGVLFSCQKALAEIEMYFVEVLRLLQLQLRHGEDVEGGLFDLPDEENSAWLRQLITRFRRYVEDSSVSGVTELRKELEKFDEFVRQRYGWQNEKDMLKRGMVELEDGERIEVSMDGLDEEEETGEYAPVIVEAT